MCHQGKFNCHTPRGKDLRGSHQCYGRLVHTALYGSGSRYFGSVASGSQVLSQGFYSSFVVPPQIESGHSGIYVFDDFRLVAENCGCCVLRHTFISVVRGDPQDH